MHRFESRGRRARRKASNRKWAESGTASRGCVSAHLWPDAGICGVPRSIGRERIQTPEGEGGGKSGTGWPPVMGERSEVAGVSFTGGKPVPFFNPQIGK